MSKKVKVQYTFDVPKIVDVDTTSEPPKPYTQEEWEEQQILDQGDKLADQLGAKDWHYEVIPTSTIGTICEKAPYSSGVQTS